MNARRQLRLTFTALVPALFVWAAPLSAEQLPADVRILTGKLSNGVTWMYRQHANPPGKMALMIHADTGSLNETDQQRGLAHFMEHMMFNGTENMPPGKLIPYFESIGMEFGADVNAFTGFDQTAYMLFLPDTKTERVDKALMVLSDYAFRALLLDEEIDKERGVILAEARTGKSAEQRMRDKLWPELYEGSRFAERLPIGKEEIIANAPRSEFVDFYRTWYRPENVTVLLVGDAEPDGFIPLVEKWFGQYTPQVPARPPLGPQFHEYGFTQRELELAKKEILADAERAVRTDPTRDARAVLFEMLSAVNDREPVLSARQELDLYKELLPTIQLAEVNKTFNTHFKPGTFAYVIEMPEKDGVTVPPRDELLAAARAAWARKVAPVQEEAGPNELLASLPAPGKLIESTMDKVLGITSAWLANGVRVHHRFMDYKEDTVIVSIALAGGGIEETEANAGVTTVAALAINEPATGRLSSTNIRDIMTGKNIRVGAGAGGRGGRRGRGGRGMRPGGDTVTVSVQGSPKDLEVGLQLAHALLTDGKIEKSAFRNWKLRTLQQLERMQSMPQFKAMEAVADLLSGSDPRRRLPSADDVNRQSVAEAQAWYERLCREAPIEVAVVGDIELEQAMPLIERYIGSLPARKRSAEHLDELRRLARPTGPLARHVEVETITPQGMAMAGFIAAEGRNTHDRRALTLASQILSTRLIKEIREDRGLVYSIRARYQPSWVYRDSAQFSAGAPCDPANAKMVAGEIHRLFEEFAQNGPTAEELANAKKQVANNLDTQMKEPSYWWRILQHYDLHGRNLADEKAEREAYEGYSVAQVRDVFQKYYKPARQFSVTAVPIVAEAEPDG